MAISLRRALISSQKLSFALRSVASLHSQSHHSIFSSTNQNLAPDQSAVTLRFANSALASFNLFQTQRGFAKGRKQKFKQVSSSSSEEEEEEEESEYEDEKSDEDVDVGNEAKDTAVSQMEAAVDALSRELAKLRTGRASEGMLDHIMVEHYGVKNPLSRMAGVSVLDPKTLSVNPYDPTALKALEKAIISSPLGLNPSSDDQRLIVPIPPLSKENIQAVAKIVAKSSEDVKKSIRRARQKALDTIKKAKKDKDSNISEDDAKRLEKEIDELTKKFIKTAEDMCKAKEKEITSI